ncbi:hypothetical protein BS47DRAFT_1335907 [Hydnum rufescens UP504]|uniref:Alpha/beta hydrolase fold-3 domain-containing protein n=1 Tax=Hydnum rufescens UP504 TaxID=1448309 RepID=A0A9P6BB88_9AGAM|nr:hypothetical protein BS47DRAFT_1335907 [Hydnum rufescens UP504]
MLEHLAGRPNLRWKRTQVFLLIGFWIWRIATGDPKGPRILYLRRLNHFLSKFTPWQIVVGTLSALYGLKNADSILGLSAPEPLAHLYSPDYYRATWINTALDTGFATAMPIRPKFLRDIISVFLSGYYLVYAREADEKLRRFRALCTVEMLRTTWEKATNPYLLAMTYFDRPRIQIMRQILLPRPPGSKYKKPISAWLFFSRSERELSWATDLILDFPGGGFICMTPQHHEERLRRWTIRTGKPVLSLDYGKAPEYPYPWAIEEGFDAYRLLVETKGRVIGMSGRALNVIMSGDSAGASLISTVMFKIIESPNPIPRPLALVFAYPALDFNFTSWMSPSHLRVLQIEQSQSSANVQGLAEQKDHFAKRSPLSVVEDVKERRVKRQKSWADSLSGTLTSLAGPLSPVTKRTRSTTIAKDSGPPQSSSTPSSETQINKPPPLVPVSTSSNSTLLKARSKASALRARLLNRASEVDNLEITTVPPPNVEGHGQNHDDGAEADAESDSEEYYPLAEQDKPISARVLYPHADSVKMQQDELSEAITKANNEAKAKKVPIGTRLTMTSRAGLFQDRIVSPTMMRAMAILYIGPKKNPDFQTDYYISPILAPPDLLVHFPTLLMVCGEKDLFVDDTVVMAGRIREAKRARKVTLRQHASCAGTSGKLDESLRRLIAMHPACTSVKDLERERERLLGEKDEDWVDVRLLEGWGHGFLLMGSMLSRARHVMDEMADWIGDVFVSASSTGVGVSQRLRVLIPQARRNLRVMLAGRSSTSPRPQAVWGNHGGNDFPGVHASGSRPRRGSSLGPSKRATPPPYDVTSASPTLPSSTVAQPSGSLPLTASSSAQTTHPNESPALNSETEPETDTPLTFTTGKHRTHRNSLGDEETGGLNGIDGDPRRESTTPRPKARASSTSTSSSSGDTAAAAPTPRLSSQAPNPLIAAEDQEKWVSSVVGDHPKAVPWTPTRQTTTSVLLSEAELMRRRRAQSVFGMGESTDGGLYHALSGGTSSDSITMNANGV